MITKQQGKERKLEGWFMWMACWVRGWWVIRFCFFHHTPFCLIVYTHICPLLICIQLSPRRALPTSRLELHRNLFLETPHPLTALVCVKERQVCADIPSWSINTLTSYRLLSPHLCDSQRLQEGVTVQSLCLLAGVCVCVNASQTHSSINIFASDLPFFTFSA